MNLQKELDSFYDNNQNEFEYPLAGEAFLIPVNLTFLWNNTTRGIVNDIDTELNE